jgi:hypothetical protein
MSKMSEMSMEIEDLVEQGMTAKFIAVTLNVPLDFVYAAIDARYELEMQMQQYEEDEC